MGVIYKGLNFDGVNSLDYGIYITGEGVYNAPTRDVEAIEVPGRNGELILDKGRFSNISVTYKAGTFAQSQAEFAEKLSEFRNAILSRVGYKRLEDDYHPDEFRMAIYTNGLEVGPVHYSEAGEFELTFNCKPQRFLKSGGIPQTIGQWGETETAEGEIATFNAEPNTAIKSLVANIKSVQEGSGDPSPTNVRPISGWSGVEVWNTGKNFVLFPYESASGIYGGIQVTMQNDGGIKLNGTCTSSSWIRLATIKLKAGTYTLSPSRLTDCNLITQKNGAYWFGGGVNGRVTKTLDETATIMISLAITSGKTYNGTVYPQFELGSSATNFEIGQGSSHSIPFKDSQGNPITVYGGNINITDGEGNGELSAPIDLGDLNWTYVTNYAVKYFQAPMPNDSVPNTVKGGEGVCSHYAKYDQSVGGNFWQRMGDKMFICNATGVTSQKRVYIRDDSYTDAEAFKTAMQGVQLCYELADPTPIYCEPTEIKTLKGSNNIWADSGEVSVEFGADPNDAYNPTPFEAHPLIEAHGYGSINMNGRNITLAQGQPVGDVVLWNGVMSSSNSLVEIPLKPTLFGSGDTFYLSAVMGFNANLDNVSFTNNTQVVSATSSSADFTVNNGSFVFGSNSMAFDVLANDIEFVAGTAKQVDVTFTIDTTAPIRTFYAYLTINYEPDNNRIRIFGTFEHNKFSIEGSCEGYSTYIPDTATYIDCEMGEAYYIENGAIVSANNSVSLPAILPELKAGLNDITYDDTITELKIVPRYWKI